MDESGKFVKNFIVDFLEIFFIGLSVFALAWFFLAEPLKVSGDSMEPVLHDKEQILVEKVSVNVKDLNRGDIVVFASPQKKGMLVIKRIIAISGDTFEINGGEVYLNGTLLKEPYLAPETVTEGRDQIAQNTKISIPPDFYLLLGDNRKNSTDSRTLGLIPKDSVIGKAVLVYYPMENMRLLNNINTLLTSGMIHKLNYTGYLRK